MEPTQANNANFSTISLFTGIGGLDFGFEEAGFETRVALELDKYACQAIRLNRHWEVIEDDINNVSTDTILETAGLRAGQVDMLIGGPPCQPFSKSSYWVRGDALRLDDPRADTLTAYLRVLRDARPRAFLLENVYGLAYQGKDEGLRLLLEGIQQINKETGTNYEVSWKVVNTADYGVPQIRERVFMIGSREGIKFKFPDPTHSSQKNQFTGISTDLQPYRTAWDALGDLAEPDNLESSLKVGGKWGDLLPSIPEGENYLWHTERGGGKALFGWRTRYWSFLLKLSKRLPSWTIQAQPGAAIGPFHWNNRRLTFQELCRIQTFPNDIKISCGRTEFQRMLGNAVPSLVAEVLAREIRKQLFGSPMESKLRLLPPRREPVPAQEPTAPLPAKYKPLIGVHAPHPGTAKKKQRESRTPSQPLTLPIQLSSTA